MVDKKQGLYDNIVSIDVEDEPSTFDSSSVITKITADNKRTRRLTSQRCPHCNAWNETSAKNCYNTFCNHMFNSEKTAETQDILSSDRNCEQSVSEQNTIKIQNQKSRGTLNKNRSSTPKNKKINTSLNNKRKISKGSNNLEIFNEGIEEVSQRLDSKRSKTCSCENPMDGSSECSMCGTTTRGIENTKEESILKSEGRRKSTRNITKDELKIKMTTEWNDEEKELLLSAIEKYGVLDLEKLSSCVVTKSKENIWSFIIQNSKTARANLLKSASSLNKAPVDDWLNVMETAQPPNYSELRTLPIARGILYISKYEQQPKPEECGGIDFKSMYETLYAFLCGLPTKKLNVPTARYFMASFANMIQAAYDSRFNERTEFLKQMSVFYTPPQDSKKYRGKKNLTKSDITDVEGMNPFQVYTKLCHALEIPNFEDFK